VDFVDDGPAGPAGDMPNDWSKMNNDGHGTFAAGLIAGNGLFSPTKALKDAINRYAPDVLDDSGNLRLIGTAPDAKIYVVRVFGNSASQGTSLSTILAAIQHVIDLREEYESTNGRHGLRIDVCNLSLGIATLQAGRGPLDQSVDELLKAGIIPVVSVGNTGPSPLTTASPGSSMSALTVGGVSQALNERILFDLVGAPELGVPGKPGVGALLRPFSNTPVAWFSSRGPNADGRLAPDIVNSAVANFGQGYCPSQEQLACAGKISLATGTSFSAPIAAGIAAALRDAFPEASATAIRNAIISTARPGEVDSGANVIDRGKGIPDAWGAFNLLASGKGDNSLPKVAKPDELVRKNVERTTDFTVVTGNVAQSFTGLRPGAHGELFYEVLAGTQQVVVEVKNVKFTGSQNPLIGDALFVDIHSAKTSSIGGFGDYLLPGFAMFAGEQEQFVFAEPDTGIMRITLSGDTLNAGLVSADVLVHSITAALPPVSIEGTIQDEKTKEFLVRVPPGAKVLEFLLTWINDWSHYPTSDIDLILYPPNSNIPNVDGATLAGPERVSIADPPAGDWRVLIDGFDIPLGTDKFQLRVLVDDVLLK
jgi:subtilisin family serine protease